MKKVNLFLCIASSYSRICFKTRPSACRGSLWYVAYSLDLFDFASGVSFTCPLCLADLPWQGASLYVYKYVVMDALQSSGWQGKNEFIILGLGNIYTSCNGDLCFVLRLKEGSLLGLSNNPNWIPGYSGFGFFKASYFL